MLYHLPADQIINFDIDNIQTLPFTFAFAAVVFGGVRSDVGVHALVAVALIMVLGTSL